MGNFASVYVVQFVKNLKKTLAGTIRTKAVYTIYLINVDPIGIFQIKKEVHKTHRIVIERISYSPWYDVKNPGHSCDQILFWSSAAGFILSNTNIS